MFRADMDGLPVEENSATYASQKKVKNLDGEKSLQCMPADMMYI